MEILDTPLAFRPPPIPYPQHSVGPTLEVAAYQYLKANQHNIDTDLIYLPIFWQSCYWADRTAKKTKDVGAVAEIQHFLDTRLDPKRTYFTVSQADEGAYERLPDNVIVFSGGGVGHVAVPLLCDDHEPVHRNRTLLASFIGTIETAGPALNLLANPQATKPSRSSWNVNGQGATVRRAMAAEFAGKPNCVIETTLRGPEAKTRFIELACSSVFALAPRGYGCTSFRMYEAMKLGAVPVYIYDDCWLPYHDIVDWNNFAVLCHLDDVKGLYDRLKSIPQSRIQDFRRNLANILPHLFTMDGAAKQIARYVSKFGESKADTCWLPLSRRKEAEALLKRIPAAFFRNANWYDAVSGPPTDPQAYTVEQLAVSFKYDDEVNTAARIPATAMTRAMLGNCVYSKIVANISTAD